MAGSTDATRIRQLGTIGIPVRDQDRALDFYVATLGFEKRMDVTYGQGQRWLEVGPAGAATTIALMAVHGSAATGIDTQVRLTSDDARADHADLLARGVDIDQEVMPYPVPMFSFRDLDGNRLIIVERPAGR
jgi:catechol 2,3-dioxygenase-like lactoylglutathione lyase family enzyme